MNQSRGIRFHSQFQLPSLSWGSCQCFYFIVYSWKGMKAVVCSDFLRLSNFTKLCYFCMHKFISILYSSVHEFATSVPHNINARDSARSSMWREHFARADCHPCVNHSSSMTAEARAQRSLNVIFAPIFYLLRWQDWQWHINVFTCGKGCDARVSVRVKSHDICQNI
jgi:hypothetical protein